jgi:hypothetical protein
LAETGKCKECCCECIGVALHIYIKKKVRDVEKKIRMKGVHTQNNNYKQTLKNPILNPLNLSLISKHKQRMNRIGFPLICNNNNNNN